MRRGDHSEKRVGQPGVLRTDTSHAWWLVVGRPVVQSSGVIWRFHGSFFDFLEFLLDSSLRVCVSKAPLHCGAGRGWALFASGLNTSSFPSQTSQTHYKTQRIHRNTLQSFESSLRLESGRGPYFCRAVYVSLYEFADPIPFPSGFNHKCIQQQL